MNAAELADIQQRQRAAQAMAVDLLMEAGSPLNRTDLNHAVAALLRGSRVLNEAVTLSRKVLAQMKGNPRWHSGRQDWVNSDGLEIGLEFSASSWIPAYNDVRRNRRFGLEVACPHCRMKIGVKCINEGTQHEASKPHVGRMKAQEHHTQYTEGLTQ